MYASSPATWDSAFIEPNVPNIDTMTSLTSAKNAWDAHNETSLHLKPDVLFATPHTPLHNDLINILICIVNYIHNGHWMNMFMRVQRTQVPRAASDGGTSAVKTVGGDGTWSWI